MRDAPGPNGAFCFVGRQGLLSIADICHYDPVTITILVSRTTAYCRCSNRVIVWVTVIRPVRPFVPAPWLIDRVRHRLYDDPLFSWRIKSRLDFLSGPTQLRQFDNRVNSGFHSLLNFSHASLRSSRTASVVSSQDSAFGGGCGVPIGCVVTSRNLILIPTAIKNGTSTASQGCHDSGSISKSGLVSGSDNTATMAARAAPMLNFIVLDSYHGFKRSSEAAPLAGPSNQAPAAGWCHHRATTSWPACAAGGAIKNAGTSKNDAGQRWIHFTRFRQPLQ